MAASSSSDKQFKANLHDLQVCIGYKFKNDAILEQAMTHESISQTCHHQRLEFLGDSVLGLVITEKLYELFAGKREGDLSKKREMIVKNANLDLVAQELNLKKYVRVVRGNSVKLCDHFEALIGALFIDGGLEPARTFVMKYCWKGAIIAQISQSNGRTIDAARSPSQEPSRKVSRPQAQAHSSSVPIPSTSRPLSYHGSPLDPTSTRVQSKGTASPPLPNLVTLGLRNSVTVTPTTIPPMIVSSPMTIAQREALLSYLTSNKIPHGNLKPSHDFDPCRTIEIRYCCCLSVPSLGPATGWGSTADEAELMAYVSMLSIAEDHLREQANQRVRDFIAMPN
ncbi:Ribonuclease 3 [Halotydeus destructor]|nr:Ribonuclease 3 [Halotydeus destructor]